MRVLLFFLFALPAMAVPPCESIAFLNAFREPAPELNDFFGDKIEIPEGDWKAFLDKELSLEDGTVITYRDFDSLSASFWRLYPDDWEPVAAQISSDLKKELSKRGIATWSARVTPTNPLARYEVPVHARKESALGRLSEALFFRGQSGVSHSPQNQMGIVAKATLQGLEVLTGADQHRPEKPLPLSFLAITDDHIPAYMLAFDDAAAINDDDVIIDAYWSSRFGRIEASETILGIEINHGNFRNDWVSRNYRRGNRAYRLNKKMLPDGPSEQRDALMKSEFSLAETMSKAVQLFEEEPTRQAAQKQLLDLVAQYLDQSGVPSRVIEIKQDSKPRWVVEVLGLPRAEWEKHYAFYSTGTTPVDGSQFMPVLTEVARKINQKGFRLLFDPQKKSSQALGLKNEGNYFLSLDSLFQRAPAESFLLKYAKEFLDNPTGSNRLTGVLLGHSAIFDSDSRSWKNALIDLLTLESDEKHSEYLHEQIEKFRAKRFFFDRLEYLSRLKAKHRALTEVTQNLERTLEGLDKIQHSESINFSGFRHFDSDSEESVFFHMTDGGTPVLFTLNGTDPTTDESAKAAYSEFKEKLPHRLSLLKEKVDQLRGYLLLLSEALPVQNRMSLEQLQDFQKRDRLGIAHMISRLDRATPKEYFSILVADRKALLHVDRKFIAEAKAHMLEAVRGNPMLLREAYEAFRPYWLSKESSYDFQDGIDFFVMSTFHSQLLAAVPVDPALVYEIAIDLAENALSPGARMHACDLLAKVKVLNDRVRSALLANLHRVKLDPQEQGPSNWAAAAIASLYPDLAVQEFPFYIEDFESPSPRGAIFAALKENRLFDKDLLLAAIEGFGLVTNSSPGAGGYLFEANSKDEEVLAALENRVLAYIDSGLDLPYRLFDVVLKWGRRNSRIFEISERYLREHPNGLEAQGASKFLLEDNSRHPAALTWLAKELREAAQGRGLSEDRRSEVVIENSVFHPWNYLETLKILSDHDPRNPAVLQGIERLELTLDRCSEPAGFDYTALNQIRERAGLDPLTNRRYQK